MAVGEVFVGRGEELAQLVGLFDDTERGRCRVVLVTGEPGIGKTRLIEELARAIGDRATVVWGRSWDEGVAPAYWPWTQILRAISPALLDRVRSPSVATDPEARFALFDAVTGGLRDAAAKHPHIIVLDDVHAADPSSLSLLLFVARELRDTRLLVIAAYRDAEARATVEQRELLARIGREAPTIELPRLLDDDVRVLIERTAGLTGPLEPIARHVVATTEGVPLFVLEVVRTLSGPSSLLASTAPLPDGVRGVLRAQLAHLSGDVRELLEHASVVGPTFTVGMVAAASDASIEVVHEAMESAARMEVLERIAPGRYAFAHVLVREVLYREIKGGDRARIHARIVDALERSGGDHTKSLLAQHALRAAPTIGAVRAVAIAIAAARSAAELLAFEDARSMLVRARAVLDLAPPDAQLRARLDTAIAELEQRAHADQPAAPIATSAAPPATLEMSSEAEVWTVRYGASLVRLPDMRGLQMLARMVASPDTEIHALELSSDGRGGTPDGGDAGAMLDAEAVKMYRARLAELEDDVREAEAWNDLGRCERARTEIEALRRELSRAVGLGGRERRAGAAAERARVNVTRRVKDAIRRIAEQDDTLGRHLDQAVHTGNYCSYRLQT